MQLFNKRLCANLSKPTGSEESTREKILQSALRLFASKGYEATTTKDLACSANVAEGTLFRYFSNKKSILVEIATQGWVAILTDLLTELSEMASYKAIAQVMRHRMLNLQKNGDLLKVCFVEVQHHPELRESIQKEVISKMTDVAEAFFQTAMDRGIYRQMNPRLVAQVFLGMFAITGFSQDTFTIGPSSPALLQEMAEGITDIFLNGVLTQVDN